VDAIRRIEPEVATAYPQEASQQVELIDYLLVLWHWRFPIVLGTLLSAGAALAVSLIIPNTYQATTTLMVTRSKFGSEQSLGPQQLALTAKTFEGIIRNRGAMGDAVEAFKLGEAPYFTKPRDLMERVETSAVKDTSLLTVAVEFRDAEMAADIANFLAKRAIELNNTLNEGEIGESRTFLETQVERTAASLKEAESALETYQKAANIEIIRKNLEIRLARYGDLEAQRTKVGTDLVAVTAALASLDKSLNEQPTTLTTSRNLVEDPAYQQALAKLPRADVQALLGINMRSEQLNPVSTFVQQKRAEVQRDVSSLTARKQELTELLAENTAALDAVQSEFIEKSTQLQRLTRAYELQRDSYKSLRSRLEATNIEVASKTSLLKVVDAAVPPLRHLRPRKTLNTMVGAVAGLLCMITTAFLSDYVQRSVKRRDVTA
jgi:polysaccharide biosynthesis transport protein